jgi:GT2 family glycosyltransferase
MPKVSIITVTRLRPQLLSQAIESLNAQSSQDFEWIIVNDGEDIATRELISNSQIDFTHTYLKTVSETFVCENSFVLKLSTVYLIAKRAIFSFFCVDPIMLLPVLKKEYYHSPPKKFAG